MFQKNASVNPSDYLKYGKNQVSKLLQADQLNRDDMEGSGVEGLLVNMDDEGDEVDEDDDVEDEQIIVTMLKSMNSKKPETGQLTHMSLEVDIEKIRQDVKLQFFKEI